MDDLSNHSMEAAIGKGKESRKITREGSREGVEKRGVLHWKKKHKTKTKKHAQSLSTCAWFAVLILALCPRYIGSFTRKELNPTTSLTLTLSGVTEKTARDAHRRKCMLRVITQMFKRQSQSLFFQASRKTTRRLPSSEEKLLLAAKPPAGRSLFLPEI